MTTATRDAFFVSSEEEEAVNATTIGALVAKFREKDDDVEEDDGKEDESTTHDLERTDGGGGGGGKDYETLRERMNRSFWWRDEGEEATRGGGGGGEDDDDRRNGRLANHDVKSNANRSFQYNHHQERQLFAPDEEKKTTKEEDVDILEVWRQRRRESELMGAPSSSSAMCNRYRIGESTHHFHDDKVEAVAKSAQTSFFREDPFVLGISKREEEREKRRKKNKKNKKNKSKNTPPIAKSKNGRVVISAANIMDENDENESDDDFSNTSRVTLAESTPSSSRSFSGGEEEIDEEQKRLEKRLDAIKVRLKKLGIF